MKVYVAKHYWKNGENATWECHNKINKKLFEYLKENYSIFVDKRPTQLKEYKQNIYLCYEDTYDEHNRKITNITFFISKKELKIDFCTYLNVKKLEIDIKEKFGSKILQILVIVGLMGAIYSNFDKVLPSSTINKNNSKIEQHNYIDLISDWNEQYFKWSEEYSDIQSFKLDRDGENNSSLVIKQLNNFVKYFTKPKTINPQNSNESKYNDFLFEYKDSNISFNINMEESEIREKLKKVTNEKTMNCIVGKVLMMNNFDIWKNEYKKENSQCLTK